MHFITLFYFISQHPNGSSILIGFPSEAHYFAFSTIQVFKNANHNFYLSFLHIAIRNKKKINDLL